MSEPNQKHILLATTDSLPVAPGNIEHVVNRMGLLMVNGHSSMTEAREALSDSARHWNFDAVVGVRFITIPCVVEKGYTNLATQIVGTDVYYGAYGTAIGW
jgi:hypothetical protein